MMQSTNTSLHPVSAAALLPFTLFTFAISWGVLGLYITNLILNLLFSPTKPLAGSASSPEDTRPLCSRYGRRLSQPSQ